MGSAATARGNMCAVMPARSKFLSAAATRAGLGLVAACVLLPAWAAPTFEPCRLEGPQGLRTVGAECTTLEVPEDPDAPDGAQIELFVARVPALTATPRRDALTVIAGGPGQASTEFYASLAAAFERVQRRRDIVLVDQRGTGRSNRLHCPMLDDVEPANDINQQFETALEQCLDRLSGDPRFYTTSVAVHDLEHVRERLGYASLNVYGVSYGTRVAQHYARRYPERVRTLVLDAPVPTDVALGPDIAPLAQQALDRALDRCQRDPDCSSTFPRTARNLDELLDRLDAMPATLSWQDPVDGSLQEGELSANEVRGALRMLSYASETVALLPLLISEAHRGHYAPLKAQAEMVSDDLGDALAQGMHNAVMCTEDAPFFDVDADSRAALEQTYLGPGLLASLERTCALWPEGVIDEDLRTPLSGDVPTLVLSGGADPITPPDYGDRVMAHLRNARHLVAGDLGHGLLPHGCVPRLVDRFIADADPANLDASCVERLAPVPFFLDFAGSAP